MIRFEFFFFFNISNHIRTWSRGWELVEPLNYKPEGRGFDFQLVHLYFSST